MTALLYIFAAIGFLSTTIVVMRIFAKLMTEWRKHRVEQITNTFGVAAGAEYAEKYMRRLLRRVEIAEWILRKLRISFLADMFLVAAQTNRQLLQAIVQIKHENTHYPTENVISFSNPQTIH